MSSKLKPSSQSSYHYSSSLSTSSSSLPRPLLSPPLWSSTRYKRSPIKRNRQRLFKMKLHKTSSVNSTSQMEHEPAAAASGSGTGNGVARSRYERNGNDNDDDGQGARQYQQDCGQFIVDKSCSSSYRYKNILASRSVPILFILVCFLVIANTNCDHASSTNGK